MAATPTFLSALFLLFSSSTDYTSHYHHAMLLFLILFVSTLSLFCFSILIFSLYSRKFSGATTNPKHPETLGNTYLFPAPVDNSNDDDSENKAQLDGKHLGHGSKATQLTRSIILEVLPADSSKWAELFEDDGLDKNGCVVDGDEEEEKKKKRKKRAKKKRPDPNSSGGGVGEEERNKDKNEELLCMFPFTTSSSAIQRKIKNQYDQLVKSHESTGLTLAQVGQFVNCLVEAKKELQHRSEVIQRKFTITKALLLKADRSSFDRLRKQIYKLELEQKRLEEDAFVYNWLQQRLKVSPAYKKILEISACMETKDKLAGEVESNDNEFADISFEELLAQEKKDAFWQRNGKTRSSSVSGQRFC